MLPEQQARLYRFDGFTVDAGRRLLLRDGRAVPINPRAFELLVVLIEQRGRVITKDELLEQVWPNQSVEEGNLTVHVSAVRKALGERRGENRYVVTVPGRGYEFVAAFDSDAALPVPAAAIASPRTRRSSVIVLFFAAAIVVVLGLDVYRSTNRGVPRITTRQLTAAGNVSSAVLSPDGKHFAYTLFDRGQESLWIGDVDDGPGRCAPANISPVGHGVRIRQSPPVLFRAGRSGNTNRRWRGEERRWVDSGFSISDTARVSLSRGAMSNGKSPRWSSAICGTANSLKRRYCRQGSTLIDIADGRPRCWCRPIRTHAAYRNHHRRRGMRAEPRAWMKSAASLAHTAKARGSEREADWVSPGTSRSPPATGHQMIPDARLRSRVPRWRGCWSVRSKSVYIWVPSD